MTRTEVFVDAAFAFALSLLVVSFDAIPHNWEEVILDGSENPTTSCLIPARIADRSWARNPRAGRVQAMTRSYGRACSTQGGAIASAIPWRFTKR